MSRAHNKILEDRGAMLARVRSFFDHRNVLEVDTPILDKAGHIDPHIDLLSTHTHFLHPSPEYGMKRLLADGIGDIYQLSHVFRKEEESPTHLEEFTMVEWYRQAMPYHDLINETLALIEELLGSLQKEEISYKEAFLIYVKIDPFTATEKSLIRCIEHHQIPVYEGLYEEGKDALLNLILGTLIEPHLGKETLTVLNHYPPSQAALAQVKKIGEDLVARRFEVYYKGIELANGYEELLEPVEQRKRLIEGNEKRKALGKMPYPIDEHFLQALEKGIPPTCGVSVGFDRLMMLRHKASTIQEIIAI